MKLLFFICTAILTVNTYAKECVGHDRYVVVYPNAPQCCEGLRLEPSAADVMGSKGRCVDDNYKPEEPVGKLCVKEGDSIPVTPVGMKQECCKGLELKAPPRGVMGSRGTCIDPRVRQEPAIGELCVQAGHSIPVTPYGPKKCCRGLELQKPPSGVMGSMGKCIDPKAPSKVQKCVDAGHAIPVYYGAPTVCCDDARFVPADQGIMGSLGRCEPKRKCLEENESLPIYPGSGYWEKDIKCCEGLVKLGAASGLMGSVSCVSQEKYDEINNGERTRKEMEHGSKDQDSSSSKRVDRR